MSRESPDQGSPKSELDEAQAGESIASLRAEIQRHDRLYHVEGRPEISDAAYDRLFRSLKDLEEAFPGLRSPDSPTERVGGEPSDDLPTVAHAAPMLSLDSTQDPDEVRRFDERVRKGVEEGEVEYLLEPKLDGVSLELVYEDGLFARAVTRGNGREGEGVTPNALTIPSVPRGLSAEHGLVPDFLSVRAEVLMALSAFEALNQALLERGEEPFANPRNATSGALRQLDPSITASRPLDCLAYEILDIRGVSFRTDREAIEALATWGFRIPERIEAAHTVDGVLSYHAAYESDRDSLDYEIDGVVIKLNDLDDRADLGSTSHHPRWAIAYKFEPRKEVTRIERIAVQVGRTGVLTPVALLLPVEVGGVTVSRASLHNREELERRDIREGDLVRVQRAGDVIPQVIEVIEEDGRDRGAPFQMPTRCPACETEVLIRGPFTVCPNRLGCPAQLKGRLVHFGSREGLDIEGLGSETAALLVESGLVREIGQLFDLSEQDLLPLEGFAETSARNLIEAIRSRRRTELTRLLYGLGIPEVGAAVARDLAGHFGTVERLREAGIDELQLVPGIGPKMAERIVGFFSDEGNRKAVDALMERMLELTVPKASGGDGPLSGKSFVFTGTLDSMSRARGKRLVEEAGARTTSAVSGETDYLVAGAGGGSKLEKAKEMGVEIVEEDGFLRMLHEAGIEP